MTAGFRKVHRVSCSFCDGGISGVELNPPPRWTDTRCTTLPASHTFSPLGNSTYCTVILCLQGPGPGEKGSRGGMWESRAFGYLYSHRKFRQMHHPAHTHAYMHIFLLLHILFLYWSRLSKRGEKGMRVYSGGFIHKHLTQRTFKVFRMGTFFMNLREFFNEP